MTEKKMATERPGSMEGLVWGSDSIVGYHPMNQSKNQKLGGFRY